MKGEGFGLDYVGIMHLKEESTPSLPLFDVKREEKHQRMKPLMPKKSKK